MLITPPQDGMCKRNLQNKYEIVQNEEKKKKRAGRFLIECVPTNVGQAHTNGRLAGEKREVSKQFEYYTKVKHTTTA